MISGLPPELPGARYRVTDMHAAGEPVRILTGGAPELRGATLLEKRRDAGARLDHVRRALMLEPRGHADMYGVWPTAPHHPGAALAVLFTHCEGYSTMCGHATIALGRWALDRGLVPATPPETRLVLECPCGPVEVFVAVGEDGRPGRVAFDSVPSFAARLDAGLDLPSFGRVPVDVAYGGAFYAVLPASRLRLDLLEAPTDALLAAAREVTAAGRAQLAVSHPSEPDLGFLYGTILTDDAAPTQPSANLCAFGAGQVDRSPTGSGASARMALDHARGLLAVGAERAFRGPTGIPFAARLERETPAGVVVRVSGEAHYSGEATFVCEPGDPLAEGFALPDRLGGPRSRS